MTAHNTKVMEEDNVLLQDLFLKGDDLQKLSVIHALPSLLESDHNATISRIIPKIQQELPNSSSEFHIASSNLFKLLFDMDLSVNLLRPVLQGIDNKDPIVANAWIETLAVVIQTLTHPAIMNDVLPFVLKLTQLNRSIFYRVSSCRLLGEIAVHPKLTPFEVKKDILPTGQSLCQDCLHEVRASMCAQLPRIAKGLASDVVVKASLLPCLVELSSDENMLVRAAAVDSSVALIIYLSPDTVSTTLIPLVKKLCVQSCKDGDHTFTSVAKSYGILLESIKTRLSDEDCVWFLNFFRQLSKKGLTLGKEDLEIETSLALVCREHCAYNLPAITSFVYKRIPSEMKTWEVIFKDLAGDPCYLVRKAVASSLQEIMRIFEKDSRLVVPDFVKLLRDEAEEVLDALVPNIGANLDLLTTNGILSVENSTQVTIEIARALLKCQVEIFKYHNWRRKVNFLIQIECLPNCMPGDFIHQHFTQVIVNLALEARARPVKTHAVKTVLYYLRYSSKENHRKWIRDWFLSNLLVSKSCYIRHIFINMCVEAMQIFSWKYFKEHFYLGLLTLLDDPVSTVRLCVVNLIPSLKQMLVLPVDRNLLSKLESSVTKVEITEKDKDVLFTLKCKLKEMRMIHGVNADKLLEEKRKIEEEDKLVFGKLRPGGSPSSQRVKSIFSSTHRASRGLVREPSPVSVRGFSAPKKPPTTSPTPRSSISSASSNSNELGFLGQHFYTDAGIVLPDKKEVDIEPCGPIVVEENFSNMNLSNNRSPNTPSEEEKVSTVSVENIDIENMSDEDLKELETSTSNITDDVKVNLQKMNKSKSMSKLSLESVKKRNKRYSCLLPTDQSHLPVPISQKRRSLNIYPGEVSRIPVSFRLKRQEDFLNKSKTVNVPSVNVNKQDIDNRNSCRLKSLSKRTSSYEPLNTKDSNEETVDIEGNSNNDNIEAKENIPLNSIKINVPINIKDVNSAKVSALPVLTRKPRPDFRKT